MVLTTNLAVPATYGIMKHLKMRDEVAYVRFASVYREFKDIETFLSELKQLKKRGGKKADK